MQNPQCKRDSHLVVGDNSVQYITAVPLVHLEHRQAWMNFMVSVPGRPPPPLDLEDMDHEYEEPAHVAADNDIEDSLNTAVGIRAPDVSVPGSCQAYKGTACAKFLKNVTVYIGSYQTQNHIEESLMAAFASIPRHTELSTQCTEYAVPSLCYHMFPVCDEGSIKKRPRELCRWAELSSIQHFKRERNQC